MESQVIEKSAAVKGLENGAVVDYNSHCPAHNTEQRKEYGFGKYRNAPCPEAWVTTYQGCSCAVCTHGASLKKIYFTNWDDAAGEARYTIQRLNARY